MVNEITTVKVKCDRCGREVEGLDVGVATIGFYRVDEGDRFHAFAEAGEKVVCDVCMRAWANQRLNAAIATRRQREGNHG